MSSVERGVNRSRSLGGFGGGEAEREGGRPGILFACLLAFDVPAVGVVPALRFLLKGFCTGTVTLFELLLFELEPATAPPPAPPPAVEVLATELLSAEASISSADELLVPRSLALLRVERVIELSELR